MWPYLDQNPKPATVILNRDCEVLLAAASRHSRPSEAIAETSGPVIATVTTG